MLELLLLDVALYAVLIMAACVMVRRWRRGSGQPSMPGSQHGVLAEPAGGGVAQRKTAIVPGFGDGTVERDFGARALAEPKQVAESQVSRVAGPQPDSNGPGSGPDERHAAADGVTGIGQIISYYDEADRPMADYLAAMGWTEGPGTHDPG